MEIHHNSNKFDKEGDDEFEDDWHLPDMEGKSNSAFTLSDATIAAQAAKLFEKTFGGRAIILRENLCVEARETLGYCNNPFQLPLNVFAYGEFKRHFTARWNNLSIQIYDTSPHNGGLWQNSRELTNEFEMSNLKNAERCYLHDYIYISTWGELLKNVQVATAIKNNRLKINCEGNLTNKQLKEFNAL